MPIAAMSPASQTGAGQGAADHPCGCVNAMEAEANGAGEVSITVTAAAIGNAVFDATGVRLRQVPFTPERVKTELKVG